MLMPDLALFPYLEEDLAVLGVDAFELVVGLAQGRHAQ